MQIAFGTNEKVAYLPSESVKINLEYCCQKFTNTYTVGIQIHVPYSKGKKVSNSFWVRAAPESWSKYTTTIVKQFHAK